jgi:hypothetical protein
MLLTRIHSAARAESKGNLMPERYSAEWREAVTFAYVNGIPIDKIVKAFGCSLSYPGYLAKRKGHALRGSGATWKRQAEGRECWQLKDQGI